MENENVNVADQNFLFESPCVFFVQLVAYSLTFVIPFTNLVALLEYPLEAIQGTTSTHPLVIDSSHKNLLV